MHSWRLQFVTFWVTVNSARNLELIPHDEFFFLLSVWVLFLIVLRISFPVSHVIKPVHLTTSPLF